jgi:hypothetical protein
MDPDRQVSIAWAALLALSKNEAKGAGLTNLALSHPKRAGADEDNQGCLSAASRWDVRTGSSWERGSMGGFAPSADTRGLVSLPMAVWEGGFPSPTSQAWLAGHTWG